MPLPYNANASRDDIADILTSRADQSPMAQMASAIPSQAMPTPPGLPATPAGGVPGSGMPPMGPSNLALPPRQGGLSMPQTGMGTMPELSAGIAPPMGPPQGMPMPPQGLPAPPQGMPMAPPQGGMGMPQGMPQMQGRRPRLY
jgi:serine/threonine-protein kinase